MIGNLIGDFVKGKDFTHYESEISKGIILHREIDSYTDQHPVVTLSKQRLRSRYRHYAPVITDVYYDHFLAANWQDYSDVPLLEYTENFYKTTQKYHDILPDQAQYMLRYMKADNWLYNYQFVEGVNRALTGMSRRTKFASGMENASQDLEEHYEAFQSEFEQFYPDLISHASNFLKSIK
ncbi:acyl carrier protein phosphodiesterase [Marinoscillum sp. MHG1-6]|uniref:acyl carrier protein phosphodiesterase n=1 Tax=Marinoscillum sp. MHG1-6 TaxID=2959627 RepID=UPI00215751DF|nr:acyl carrier protein phosphodiesterase [Marinoscillum sp. MHG1-6]